MACVPLRHVIDAALLKFGYVPVAALDALRLDLEDARRESTTYLTDVVQLRREIDYLRTLLTQYDSRSTREAIERLSVLVHSMTETSSALLG